MLWVLHHIREKELSCLLEDGIDSLAKKLYIPGEPEVLPHLKGDPHAGRNEDSPAEAPPRSCVAPGIGDDVADPAGSIVERLGRASARCAQFFNQCEERSLRLREISNLSEPVVLLGINVQMEVIGPTHTGSETVVPDSLQCQRQRRVRARARYREIASELEEQSTQPGVARSCLEGLSPLVGRSVLDCRLSSQVDMNPAEESLMIHYMTLAKLSISLG